LEGGLLAETGRKKDLAEAAARLDIAEEDLVRAHWYGLLGAVLRNAPDRARLGQLAALTGDETDFGQSVSALAGAARAALAAGPEALDQEYFDLFIGVGRGELLPYGSYYLAGFLYEKPLARLRADMRRLGIARAAGVHEPEDHIAALLEMMSGLITGAFGGPADIATQRQFFAAHLGSWGLRFFEDLETATSAGFYQSVGRIGRRFLAIEDEAFEMTA
jgi:TorA maturation chaperone TorD